TGDEDFGPGRMSELGIDPNELTPDPHPGLSDDAFDGESPFATDRDDDDDAGEGERSRAETGASRDDLHAAYGAADASEEAVQHTQFLATLTKALQALVEVEHLLPEFVEYAADGEIEAVGNLSEKAAEMAQVLVKESQNRAAEGFDAGSDF
ncbi:MAG: hypothetical protein L0H93_19120, partial [Nocardioides sp.]|nr:hypothetical protein [Nocardioides sp.]